MTGRPASERIPVSARLRQGSGGSAVASAKAGASKGVWRGEAPQGTLVLCLGNDLRADDGVGWRVADLLQAAPPSGAVVHKSGLNGMYLLDELVEFEHVIVVDAVQTRTHMPGDVFALPVDGIHSPPGPSPHAIGLPSVLRVARSYGLSLPSTIDVVAIEVADVETVGGDLTTQVAAAVPRAEQVVRQLVAARSRGSEALR